MKNRGKLINNAYKAVVVMKGLDGILEIIGGISLFFIKPSTIDKVVVLLTQHELSKDPDDFIANFLIQLTHGLSIRTEILGGIYLLFHGIVKIIIVVALLKNNLRAYKFALIFLLISFFYQLYRFTLNHSLLLLLLSVFDGVLIWFLLGEHNKLQKSMSK